MRVRTALLVIAAVNVLWAAAFLGYVQRSTTPVARGGEIIRQTEQGKTPAKQVAASNAIVALSNKAAAVAVTPNSHTTSAVPANLTLTPTGRQFGWQDVTNEVYKDYIARLRLVGCPEKQVRTIVFGDVNDLIDKRRLDHAVRTDMQWWRADTYFGGIPVQNMMASGNYEQERRDLLDKLLGPGWEVTIKLPPSLASSVPLTGPVLGALPADTWNTVQDVCSRSMEKHNNYMMARINEGQPMDPVQMAQLRNFTRTELSKILTPEQMEEFLLRYSHNSTRLRQDLRGLDLTPDEFRKVFRALDPIEHRMQLDYGGPEALSQKQREQFETQRDRAIRETLPPERYQQYQLTRDPLYKQAQMTALQYGMNGKAIQPIYELQKSMEARRVQITQNAALTPEQKSQALQSVATEQQQSLQKLMGNTTYRQ
ncbi:MAG TPA: hypothetical protein VK530_04730 [Candidatus Acidoferrum sp.]|nr:hypothetical protein [Candidatus Acidoferrum sp.]